MASLAPVINVCPPALEPPKGKGPSQGAQLSSQVSLRMFPDESLPPNRRK